MTSVTSGIRPAAEQKGPDRTAHEGDRGEEGHLGQRDVEVFADLGVHEDDEEVVKRVHRPAHERGDERVALALRQPPGLLADSVKKQSGSPLGGRTAVPAKRGTPSRIGRECIPPGRRGGYGTRNPTPPGAPGAPGR